MHFIENEIKELGPGFWIRTAVDNISWYDLGNGVAVIDALEDAGQADVVRGAVQNTTGSDLRWIVQTHWDTDHIACNPQWKHEGAVAIAHQSCLDSAGAWPGRPDIAYDSEAVVQGSGDKKIEMRWLGGTHTPWDSVLYFPAARVLHIADLFGWGLVPCQPTPAKLRRLDEVLDVVESYDADTLVCGHGPTLKLEHVRRFRSYFKDLCEQVAPLKASGLSAEQIEARVSPPADMVDWWRFTAWKHSKNIALICEFTD